MRNYVLNIKSSVRTFSIALILLFLTSASYGQSTFTLKDNDLDRSPNLSIGGTIIGVDIYNPNLAFFIEGKLAYRLKKELGWIKGHYTLAFGDRLEAVTESSSSQDALPAEGTQPLRSIGGSIGVNLIKRTDIKLARATFLNRSRSKKITLPLKQYRLYGLHAGYEVFRTVIAQGSTMSYSGTIVEKSLNGKEITSGNATPMFHMNIISFGIHRQYVEHWKVQVTNEGERTDYSSKRISTVYADFLLGTNMGFDDIMVPLNMSAPNTNTATSGNGSYEPYNYYRVDISKSYKMIPIGGRIGWEEILLKPAGVMAGAEFGFRPGILNPVYNVYVMVKIGFMFNFKAK